MIRSDTPELIRGHRERMRTRLLRRGTDAMESYELLEILLYHIIPRTDTYPTAKTLIAEFGGLFGVFEREKRELLKIPGVGEKTADFIINAGNLINAKASWDERPALLRKEDFIALFASYFKGKCTSEVVLLSLDNSLRAIAIDKISDKDLSSSKSRTSDFVSAALHRRAAAVALAHNHPYTAAFATEGDLEKYRAISDEFSKIGIPSLGSYIISASDINVMGAKEIVRKKDESAKEAKREKPSKELFELISALCSHTENGYDAAKPLLENFPTKEALFTAERSALLRLTGSERTAELFTLISALASRTVTDLYEEGKKYTEADIERLIKGLFINRGRECAFLIAFDGNGRFISYEKLSDGSVSELSVSPRSVLDRASELSAKSVILAHNHPSGTSTPSDEDMTATKIIKDALATAGVKLSAHYIAAQDTLSKISGT